MRVQRVGLAEQVAAAPGQRERLRGVAIGLGLPSQLGKDEGTRPQRAPLADRITQRLEYRDRVRGMVERSFHA